MSTFKSVLAVEQLDDAWGRFDLVIDARSPGEFAEDHLPGAVNFPVLDDEERARVGTLYKQTSAFEAKKVGAALVARRIAHHLETAFADLPRNWRPLVYCSRGGERSHSLTLVLNRVGWQAVQLTGGYKAFRRHVIAALDGLAQGLQFRVLCGMTGTGKTRILQALADQGHQVLDLEGLAAHRGSLLGDLPDAPQPGQKRFETLIWAQLRRFDPQRPVYVEAESRRVGNLRVPDTLLARIRAGRCLVIEADTATRVALLLDEYRHFVDDRATLLRALGKLVPLHGHETVANWCALAETGAYPVLVEALLAAHYDPAYTRSTSRNFPDWTTAPRYGLPGPDPASVAAVARRLAVD